MNKTADEIKDGKYQNVTEARQGYGRNMAAAMGFGAGGPPRGGQR